MPNPAQEITVSLAQSPDLIAAACALVDSRDDNAHPWIISLYGLSCRDSGAKRDRGDGGLCCD